MAHSFLQINLELFSLLVVSKAMELAEVTFSEPMFPPADQQENMKNSINSFIYSDSHPLSYYRFRWNKNFLSLALL